jgi:hypothetical protein
MTERDAKLDARYRELASEEPSVVIDDAIRAAARRAVAARPKSFERRWGPPVAIAAVLVLATGVTLRMQLEQPGVEAPTFGNAAPAATLAERQQAPAASAVAPLEAEADTRGRRVAPAVAQAPPPAPAPKAARVLPEEAKRKLDVVQQKSELAPQKPEPVQLKPEPVQQKKDQPRHDENLAAQVAAAPALEARQVPAPFPASPAATPSPARERKEEAAGIVTPQPLAKARDAESAVATDKLMAEKATANAAATGRVGFAAQAPAPAAPSGGAAREAPATISSGAVREAPARADRVAALPAEKELERIAQLRRDGHDAEADEAFARFKREHPDYRIADDMLEKVRPR